MTDRSQGTGAACFAWNDFSRFVEISPVERGWLVLWGQYRDAGRSRDLRGNRTYRDLAGARRRVADAVFELTHDPALVSDALVRFDRTVFPQHVPAEAGEPL